MGPAAAISDLDVVIAHPAGQDPRVEIIDKRTRTEIVSLTPAEARLLGIQLVERGETARTVPPLPKRTYLTHPRLPCPVCHVWVVCCLVKERPRRPTRRDQRRSSS